MPKDLTPEDRAALIERLRTAFNLSDDWATRAAEVGDEFTDDELRADAREAAQTQRAARTPAMVRVHGANDDPAQIITRQSDAVAYRMAGGELPAASREFVNLSLMDIDVSGNTEALTDGVMLIRYLFGIRGAALTQGAIGSGAMVSSPEDIAAKISALMP